MTRGIEHYFERIREAAYVTVYAADNTAMLPYPYRLGRPGKDESSPSIASKAESYILDSGIGEDSWTNEDVIDRGREIGADVVVPTDVLGDPEATTPHVLDMIELLDGVDGYNPDVAIPVQSDSDTTHLEHYQTLSDRLNSRGFDVTDCMVALGGLNDAPFIEQLEAVNSVREAAGIEQHIHALGFGASRDWCVAIHRRPDLLDSFDVSTFVQSVVNGTMHDTDFQRVTLQQPRGECSTALSATLRRHQLHQLNHLLGPLVRESDRPTEFTLDGEGLRRAEDIAPEREYPDREYYPIDQFA